MASMRRTLWCVSPLFGVLLASAAGGSEPLPGVEVLLCISCLTAHVRTIKYERNCAEQTVVPHCKSNASWSKCGQARRWRVGFPLETKSRNPKAQRLESTVMSLLLAEHNERKAAL